MKYEDYTHRCDVQEAVVGVKRPHMIHGLYFLSGQLVIGKFENVVSLFLVYFVFFRFICCRYRFL